MKLLYQVHTGHKPDLLSVFVYICLSLPYVIVATQALVCCLICPHPHSPSGIVDISGKALCVHTLARSPRASADISGYTRVPVLQLMLHFRHSKICPNRLATVIPFI